MWIWDETAESKQYTVPFRPQVMMCHKILLGSLQVHDVFLA